MLVRGAFNGGARTRGQGGPPRLCFPEHHCVPGGGSCVWLAGQLSFGPSPLKGHGIVTAFKIELEPSFMASRIWSQPTCLYQGVHAPPVIRQVWSALLVFPTMPLFLQFSSARLNCLSQVRSLSVSCGARVWRLLTLHLPFFAILPVQFRQESMKHPGLPQPL